MAVDHDVKGFPAGGSWPCGVVLGAAEPAGRSCAQVYPVNSVAPIAPPIPACVAVDCELAFCAAPNIPPIAVPIPEIVLIEAVAVDGAPVLIVEFGFWILGVWPVFMANAKAGSFPETK